MKCNIDSLIHGYLDESLSSQEMGALNDWIKADSGNAKKFAEISLLHDRLEGEIQASSEPSNVISFEKDKPKVDKKKNTIRDFGFWGVVAATIVFLIGINAHRIQMTIENLKGQNNHMAGIASLVRLESAEFYNKSELVLGQTLGTETIRLISGSLCLHYESGVEVSLQGPAEYEIVGPDITRLNSGLVTVNVPPGAEGFRVDTPTAKFTDLGASFGLRLDENGTSHLSVFEGEVEVETDDSEEGQLLHEGESAIIEVDAELKKVELDTKSFEKVWPVSLGIAGSSGSFQLAPPWPRRLGLIKSDDYIFVVPDGYLKSLQEPVQVNITEPGKVDRLNQLSPGEVSTDFPVRSFLLHYQPEAVLPRKVANRLKGSITFDGPILGVIVLHEEFLSSQYRFSRRKTGVVKPRRQLDLNGTRTSDIVELSEDRRTLSVDLLSFRRSSDHIRVIVDASGRN